MTDVLEREKTGSTTELRRPVEIPPREVVPPQRFDFVRWLGWILTVAVIVSATILVINDRSGVTVVPDDGSFATNELARMMALEPEIDLMSTFDESIGYDPLLLAATLRYNILKQHSFEASFPTWMEDFLESQIVKQYSFEGSFPEVATLLAPAVDTSFDANELARMLSLAPTVDTSFDDAELARMLTLAPTVDTSFEANELARMLTLAPTVDTSFDDAELARMSTLAPTVDDSFEMNELARMLRLAPEG